MNIPSGFINGIFLAEEKNRFLCTVEIDGAKETCYIASSCRLDNFINLHNRPVLLKRTSGANVSTRYAVYAVKHKKSFILLNTSLANKAVENTIKSRKLSSIGKRSDIKKEHKISGYRADFFIPCSKTIIEVKSVITTEATAVFPTVFSERSISQLALIEELLSKGYKAQLIIVSLNPYVKEISIAQNTTFYESLSRCLALGLKMDAFTCRLNDDGEVYIQKRLPLSWC